jgi:hypothetical protein
VAPLPGAAAVVLVAVAAQEVTETKAVDCFLRTTP